MGTEDTRRQKPNVQRMELLGATVKPVDAGAKTLKEATSAAIRDWVTNVESTHYVIGSVVGPAPYPALVRDLQRVIGDEARAQMLEREGRLPGRVIACVGGGSNAIGTFAAFLDDEQVELIGVEAGGEGIETPRHGAPLTVGGRAGILHGSRSAVMQDEEGQIIEAHSVSAGLDYPGAGPQHAYLRDSGRARYVAVTDREALAAFREVARLEGIIPALETAHALAWTLAQEDGELDLVCLSGRGDKDLAEVLGEREHERDGAECRRHGRRADRGRRSRQTEKRAALMPYLMGGYPTLADSVKIGEACIGAGADIIELGMPYSDPLADGPVIHAAGTQALAAGANVAGILEVARALAESVPVVLMCYANMVMAPGAEAFVERLAKTGASGLIVPDLPLGEGPEVGEACEAHGLALVPLVAPTTTPERLGGDRGERARGSCTRSRSWARPASGSSWASASRRSWRGRRRAPRRRSRWASGSARPSTRDRPRRRAPTG